MEGTLIIVCVIALVSGINKYEKWSRRKKRERYYAKRDAEYRAKNPPPTPEEARTWAIRNWRKELEGDFYNTPRALAGVYRDRKLNIYLVKLTSDKESFYKIGLTRGDVLKRNPGDGFYTMEVLCILRDSDATLAVLSEQMVHDHLPIHNTYRRRSWAGLGML